MAESRKNLMNYLMEIEQAVEPFKFELALDEASANDFRERFARVGRYAAAAIGQVKKIRRVAARKRYADILAILDERVEP